MKFKQIQEAKYYNINAAVWVQNAVDREFDVYQKTGSWPKVVQKLGHQEFKFEHSKALADLTKEYGPPDQVRYDEQEREDGDVFASFWKVGPTIAYSETDQDDYITLDVGLDDTGVVTIWDVTDA